MPKNLKSDMKYLRGLGCFRKPFNGGLRVRKPVKYKLISHGNQDRKV